MEKIKVMVSSTVTDLIDERTEILSVFNNYDFFELIGATPFISGSSAKSSAAKTIQIARDCDLYILLLGNRFGWELENGKSATEVEFDAAIKQDPTKILVFLKKTAEEPEKKQKKFIDKVSEYYSGYWRVEFEKLPQLHEYVKDSVLTWLRDRASLNNKVSIYEHFIREAIQLKPTPDTKVFYSVREDYIEMEYCCMRQSHSIHCDKTKIYNNFWILIREIQEDIRRWTEKW